MSALLAVFAAQEVVFDATFWRHMASAAIYSVLGVVLFGVMFVVVDKMTPVDLWKEIHEDKNVALAVLFGCWAIAMGIIIAAAIHG